MTRYSRSPLTAVLGPTNTGKTHIAVERMLGHSSGMIGFPLRLLAREVYDRVVAMKGESAAALITGEERIWPETARYLLCTAEAMPITTAGPLASGALPAHAPGDVAFVALDEAQLGQDRERGHVFTSRLLHARGREETMLLGAGALAPVVRSLLPDADIISRPRFSTLSYDGPRKLSRLPPRSAIVAFSTEQVYAIAEALRRFSGGAAVVMGALSPRTRNAQVAMFQAGEVDYIVATDAIGMGLNLDIAHVAFAGLEKFDGQRQRRLTIAEMAQIAGRAGRHQRDGSFGSVGADAAFTPEEIAAIEGHHFPPLDWLYWRDPAPALDSVATLVAALEAPPTLPTLRAAPQSTDLAVLKYLEGDAEAMALIDGPASVARLWAACSLPDFRKAGVEAHGRFVARLWRDLGRDNGQIDADWFISQLRPLDKDEGSVEQLADRIAAVRSHCYIAQRRDWLADPLAMAAEAHAIEARLSDALHNALTARFVDRRTSVLLRALGQDASALPVKISDEGAVLVDGEAIGVLDGFAFRVDPAASAGDQRMLLAAAEKYLAVELARRASALATARNADLALALTAGQAPAIEWHGRAVAHLVRGRNRLAPKIELDRAIAALDPHVIAAVLARLTAYVDGRVSQHLRALATMAARARDPQTPGPLRALFAALVDGSGTAERSSVESSLVALDEAARADLRQSGVRIGTLDLFHPLMMKAGSLQWLAALDAAWRHEGIIAVARDGVGLIPVTEGAPHAPPGFRQVGQWWLRVDLVERVALHAHTARKAALAQAAKPAAAPAEAVAEPAEGAESAQGTEAETEIAVAADSAPIAPPMADRPAEDPDPAPVAAETPTPAKAPPPPRPGSFAINPELARSIGLPLADRLLLLRLLGFRMEGAGDAVDVQNEGEQRWVWRGRRPDRHERPRRQPHRTHNPREQRGSAGEAQGQRAQFPRPQSQHRPAQQRSAQHRLAQQGPIQHQSAQRGQGPQNQREQAPHGQGKPAPANAHNRRGDRVDSRSNQPPRTPQRREPINNPFGILASLLSPDAKGDGKGDE